MDKREKLLDLLKDSLKIAFITAGILIEGLEVEDHSGSDEKHLRIRIKTDKKRYLVNKPWDALDDSHQPVDALAIMTAMKVREDYLINSKEE